MGDDDSVEEGFREGLADSKGDPRVLLAMNAVLSILFAWTVVGGLSIIDLAEFSALNVATATIIVFALTYYVTMS